jgi:hypothetical protein
MTSRGAARSAAPRAVSWPSAQGAQAQGTAVMIRIIGAYLLTALGSAYLLSIFGTIWP